ncbi:MAG TPA: ATP-binding protein [Pseudonocardiaceae bacterium]|jgi:serine/threonine-protein kinase RsbW|nr:ATP-binding protein [Pseudonocardiaceae bacterium]
MGRGLAAIPDDWRTPRSKEDDDGRCGGERRINWCHYGHGPIAVTYVDRDCASPNGGTRPAEPSCEESVQPFELHTAASTIAIPTIRMVAADLAARADFDLDSIDDLRMAVDDLCAMLVRIAADKATLSCRFTVQPERIEVAAEVVVDGTAEPLPTGSFGWRVLECLADEVSAVSLPAEAGRRDRVRITLAKDAVRAQEP